MIGVEKEKTIFELEAPPPDLGDLLRLCHPRLQVKVKTGGSAADAAIPPWSGPGSQRSGCIPAEPYPLLRPEPAYAGHRKFVKVVVVVDGEK